MLLHSPWSQNNLQIFHMLSISAHASHFCFADGLRYVMRCIPPEENSAEYPTSDPLSLQARRSLRSKRNPPRRTAAVGRACPDWELAKRKPASCACMLRIYDPLGDLKTTILENCTPQRRFLPFWPNPPRRSAGVGRALPRPRPRNSESRPCCLR